MIVGPFAALGIAISLYVVGAELLGGFQHDRPRAVGGLFTGTVGEPSADDLDLHMANPVVIQDALHGRIAELCRDYFEVVGLQAFAPETHL